MTMNVRMSVIMTTTKAHILTSICSADRCWCFGRLSLVNLLLQDRGHHVLRASLRELAAWFLALLFVEIVRILAEIPVPFLAGCQQTE
jgi:hypothetical protein